MRTRGIDHYRLLSGAEAPNIVPVHHKQLATEGILQDGLGHEHRPSTEQGGRLEGEVFPRKEADFYKFIGITR